MWTGSEEIRCASPEGNNKTAIAVKLCEELYATSYESSHEFRGDIFGLLEEFSNKNFVEVMRKIHNLFGLSYSKGKDKKKKLDLLEDLRKYKHKKYNQSEIIKFDRSVLNEYVKLPHVSLIEEAISPAVIDQFDVMFDTRRDRIVFPHFYWEDDSFVVGVQGRTTMSSDLAKELGIPKYFNNIKGFRKSSNLYGYSTNKQFIEERKMVILFEGEKSTLKEATISFGKGCGVSLGGHEVSRQQVEILLKDTKPDCEIVIAFDKDVMADEQYLIDTCKKFSKYRKCSYIYDTYGVLGEKDSPIDLGMKIYTHLLKYRKQVK